MSMYCSKFTVIKGKFNAFQMSPIPPTWAEGKEDKEGRASYKVTREGSLFIEMAKFLEERDGNCYYDWAPDKKLDFALGMNDIFIIMDKEGTKFSLTHDHPKGLKTMQFNPGEGKYEGTMRVTLGLNRAGAPEGTFESIQVAFSKGEWIVFTRMLLDSVSVMLGWDEVSNLVG